jgi:histidinol-phosphate aminotransferase
VNLLREEVGAVESIFGELAREEIRDLPIYVPGKPIDEVKRELGLTEIIKLASNENPWGPSPRAILAMREAVGDINRYPDAGAFTLKSALGESYGLSSDHLLLGNGSEEIVQMIAKAFFRPGEEILMGKPSFPRYETVTRLMGAIPREIALEEGYYPLRGLVSSITEKTRAIFICNPNNPTGTVLSEQDIRAFVEQVPSHILLIFDEAYIEFSEQSFSGLAFLDEPRPIIVLRTFSKAFGLAGIRLGYAIARPELTDALNRVREPFNSNAVALAGALAAWQDQGYLEEIIQKNSDERRYVTGHLLQLGARIYPTETNFIFAFFENSSSNLSQKLLERGIIVRPGAAFGYPAALRITFGTHEENEKFIHALGEIMEMDKV